MWSGYENQYKAEFVILHSTPESGVEFSASLAKGNFREAMDFDVYLFAYAVYRLDRNQISAKAKLPHNPNLRVALNLSGHFRMSKQK